MISVLRRIKMDIPGFSAEKASFIVGEEKNKKNFRFLWKIIKNGKKYQYSEV